MRPVLWVGSMVNRQPPLWRSICSLVTTCGDTRPLLLRWFPSGYRLKRVLDHTGESRNLVHTLGRSVSIAGMISVVDAVPPARGGHGAAPQRLTNARRGAPALDPRPPAVVLLSRCPTPRSRKSCRLIERLVCHDARLEPVAVGGQARKPVDQGPALSGLISFVERARVYMRLTGGDTALGAF